MNTIPGSSITDAREFNRATRACSRKRRKKFNTLINIRLVPYSTYSRPYHLTMGPEHETCHHGHRIMHAIHEDLGWWYDVKVVMETDTHFTLQWVDYPRWPKIEREKSKYTFALYNHYH